MRAKSDKSIYLLLIFWIAMYSNFNGERNELAEFVVVVMSVFSGVMALMLTSLTHEQKMKMGRYVTSYTSDILPDVLFNSAAIFIFLANGYLVCAVATAFKSYMVSKILTEVLKVKIATGEIKD